MFRIPKLAEIVSLFIKPTVARALADVHSTIAKLKEAEAHAAARIKATRVKLMAAYTAIDTHGATIDGHVLEAQQAARVGAKLADLVS